MHTYDAKAIVKKISSAYADASEGVVTITADDQVDWHDLGKTHQPSPSLPTADQAAQSLTDAMQSYPSYNQLTEKQLKSSELSGYPLSDKGGSVIDPETGENTTPVTFVDPATPVGKQIAACDVATLDLISTVDMSDLFQYEGIVTQIKLDSKIGCIVFTFQTGVTVQIKPTDLVTLKSRGNAVTAVNGHVGTVWISLRLDGDLDAQNAARAYAIYISNSKPELAQAILTQLIHIQSGIPPLDVM